MVGIMFGQKARESIPQFAQRRALQGAELARPLNPKMKS